MNMPSTAEEPVSLELMFTYSRMNLLKYLLTQTCFVTYLSTCLPETPGDSNRASEPRDGFDSGKCEWKHLGVNLRRRGQRAAGAVCSKHLGLRSEGSPPVVSSERQVASGK